MRVTGAWTGLLTDWLARRGLHSAALAAELERWAMAETVPIPVWRDLLAQALALVPQEPAAELEIGAGVEPAHVGVLGYLVLASETLGDALRAYQRYETLFYGERLADVAMLDGEVEIRWPRPEQPLGRQGDGVGIAALVTFLRRQIDQPPPLSRVSFRGSVAQATDQAYQAFFGCPVQWQDSHVRVRFPLSYLTMAMPGRDPALRQLLDRQAQALLRALPASTALERQLQQVLLRLLAEGDPTLARAARVLHMSPRTLQRRLRGHGLSWQQWLDRSREQLARQYLADPVLSLAEVALLLGFSEQSAFTRAFRRWTGTLPGQYRRQHVALP
ncbi:AraC family transcriptional regulator [Marinobacter xestospongiae]